MVINSLISAFQMYSRIPMPRVDWTEENRRYALCFFPLVGAAVGAAELLCFLLRRILPINPLLFGAAAAAAPLIVTGGIHIDGYMDVCDALASWAGREKMLEIMDDPHVGSFAAVRAALYLLVQAGLFAQIENWRLMAVCSLAFIQSRALSGLCSVVFKSAKSGGALQSFRLPAKRKVVAVSTIAIFLTTSAAAILADTLCGLCALAAEAACLVRCKNMFYKKFGGITGDLAGYFLQSCELAALAAAVLCDLIRTAVL